MAQNFYHTQLDVYKGNKIFTYASIENPFEHAIVGGTAYGSNGGDEPYDAIDGSMSSYYSFGTTSGWWKYDFGVGVSKIIKRYTLMFYSNDHSAKDWKFQGSNDNSNWTDLDIQSNVTDWVDEDMKNFQNFSEGENTTAYRFYRLNVSDGNGIVFLSEIQFYTEKRINYVHDVSHSEETLEKNFQRRLLKSSDDILIYFGIHKTGSNNQGIYYKTSTNEGSTWSDIIEIEGVSDQDDVQNLDCFIDTNDDIYIVYSWQYSTSERIYFRKLTYISGGSWSIGNRKTLSTDSYRFPVITKRSNGDLWVGSIEGSDDIAYYYSTDDGDNWSAETTLDVGNNGNIYAHRMIPVGTEIWWFVSHCGESSSQQERIKLFKYSSSWDSGIYITEASEKIIDSLLSVIKIDDDNIWVIGAVESPASVIDGLAIQGLKAIHWNGSNWIDTGFILEENILDFSLTKVENYPILTYITDSKNVAIKPYIAGGWRDSLEIQSDLIPDIYLTAMESDSDDINLIYARGEYKPYDLIFYNLPLEDLLPIYTGEENLNINDSFNYSWNYTKNENISISDSAEISNNFVNFEDGIILQDNSQYNIDLTKTELLDLSDELRLLLEQENFDYLYLSDNGYFKDGIANIFNENINLNDSIFLKTNIKKIETINISDSIFLNLSKEKINQTENLIVSDILELIATTYLRDIADTIIVDNYLIGVTKYPTALFKLDLSVFPTISAELYELSASFYEINNAKTITYNEVRNKIYIGCANGKILEVDFTDFENQELYSVNDTNNLLTSTFSNESQNLVFGTNDTEGEIILLDYSISKKISTDLRWLLEIQNNISTLINTIFEKHFTTDIRILTEQTNNISTDIRFLISNPYTESYEPIKRTDFEVYINGIKIDDVNLESISIYHVVGEKSKANFRLARKHDNLNYMENGTYSEITNQNNVIIKIQGHTEFSGKISELLTNSESEEIYVDCLSLNNSISQKNTVNMPLSNLDESLIPYDIIISDISINNPYIDPNEENPYKYKGIKAYLGTNIKQRYFQYYDSNIDVESIKNGSWQPRPNREYFYTVDIEDLVYKKSRQFGFSEKKYNKFIGQSLAPLTTDNYIITDIDVAYQIQLDNIETDLGYYEIGEAPFKEISTKNGQIEADDYWEMNEFGWWNITPEYNNHIEYTKKVAELEYEKLININGDILPVTSCDIDLMIDGYYYYNLKLLNRINITNTSTKNIYNKNNGFPVGIKSIEISSLNMKVKIKTDNQKTEEEIEEINNRMPDEESNEFNFPERRYHKAYLYDLPNDEDIKGSGFDLLNLNPWQYGG